MRLGKVFGAVTLARAHPALAGARLRLAIPMSADELPDGDPRGDSIVVWDNLGVGPGSLIAVSEGAEAAQPFRPEIKPIDAYVAALIDHLEVEGRKS